ncbi:N-acetyltransferase family protein [Variovorax sp. GT1P44]|uniref:GNAT family N-acetyltransferase n=1 Tax=Variovorax sp. GT1P44 TaxID=3443742 RepID=UPI003F44AD4D
MTNEIDDWNICQTAVVLRDGTRATIRAMRPNDRDRLKAMFAELERESVYTRFFGYLKELPEEWLNRASRVDFIRRTGLVVTIRAGDEEIVIGSATSVAVAAPDGAKAAEVAFTVEEDYQGQGLAGRLLTALADIARRHGIERFTADVLSHNAAMLAVFRRSGLPMRSHREGGVTHVELDLGLNPTCSP